LVLIAAEQGGGQRLLPAGPLREGPRALRRATAVIVTRKSATVAEAEAAAAAWTGFAGAPPVAIVALRPAELVPVHFADGPAQALSVLAGTRVLAVSAIGNPAAFERQLQALGATVTSAAFPDHHAFSEQDGAHLASQAGAVDRVVCTLKDAVKLASLWPRGAAPLWYLSQAVEVERGGALIRDALRRLVPGSQP
jgi:tetraacyldisaccharide 4'-kinase